MGKPASGNHTLILNFAQGKMLRKVLFSFSLHVLYSECPMGFAEGQTYGRHCQCWGTCTGLGAQSHPFSIPPTPVGAAMPKAGVLYLAGDLNPTAYTSIGILLHNWSALL